MTAIATASSPPNQTPTSSSLKRVRRPIGAISYALAARRAVTRIMVEASSMSPDVPLPASKPKRNVIREPARPRLRIMGESFYVEHEAETYYILHERWSLMGAGESLGAAYRDLLDEAAAVVPAYRSISPGKLDRDGARLQKFLLRFA